MKVLSSLVVKQIEEQMESESIFQAGGNTLNNKWENSYLLRDVLCGLLREFSLQTSHSLDFSDFILNCMKKKLKKIIYKNSILCQWVPKYKQCQSVKTTYELLNLSLTKRWTPSSDTLTPVARDGFECLVRSDWSVVKV